MVSRHGIIFLRMEEFWFNLRYFFYSHKTLFDVMFLFLYFLEQLILIYLILIKPENAHIYAGTFALLFITTISFEKICMESRYRTLNENTIIYQIELNELEKEYNVLVDENKRMKELLEQLQKELKK
ncbi:hypothetical protein J4442_01185 [Candidatus Woesearchaeota archaeon]|nr:hypothetical protein [Candidatus Woesearchaeota archaeon]